MGVSRWNAKLHASRKATRAPTHEINDLELAAFLAAQKKHLLLLPASNSSKSARAGARRQARALRTKFLNQLLRRQGRKRRVLRNVAALLYAPKPDIVRDSLCPAFLDDWRPMRRRMRHKTVEEFSLKGFSFARNPGTTLKRLSELADACALFPDLRVNFLDTDCDDVTPYVVLSHLTRSLPPIISGGRITHEVSEVVEAVGMKAALRIGSIAWTADQDAYSVSAFRLVHRTPPGAFGDEDHLLRPQVKEWVADKFCETINGWLREHELELTQHAESSFVTAIGEALDNAERHGGPAVTDSEGDWSIAGFSRLQLVDGAPLLRCSVGIVSVGTTISDSLSSAAPVVQQRIDAYVERNTPLFRARHSVEALRTVMALQDGITRVESATLNRRGGVGFMELIEAFAELGMNDRADQQSVFTIISGRTCVRVTAPYRCGERKETGLRELWFNPDNDGMAPPSQEHVMTLNESFPGVILSACFTIDPDYLRKNLSDADDDG